jgi:uncharacterized membrane protein YedE/YeeE
MSALPLPAPTTRRSTLRALAALASGFVFGIGLSLARMIDPRKVLGFLDVAGDWDPSLLFVLGGAVVVAFLGYRLVQRRGAPLLDARFHLRDGLPVDRSLVTGALVFGMGWGLAGYCPGPAISSLGFANPEAFWLVPGLLLGAGLQRWQAARRRAGAAATN